VKNKTPFDEEVPEVKNKYPFDEEEQ
jgi:hypothetical protein